MAADNNYDGYLDKLADRHAKRLSEALQELEDRIAAALDAAPVKAGALFDLEWAVKARPELSKIMGQTYLKEAASVLKDYSAVSVKALDMLNEYGSFTQTSPDVIKQLQSLTFKGFEDIATSHLDTISSEIYQSTLTGRAKTDMVKAVRQSVNGVYISSDNDAIEKLVNIAKNGSPDLAALAVDELHSVYASDRVGNNMRRYATQMAQDSLMQFDAAINTSMGRDAGIDTWKYYGDLINDSRQFCRDHVGKVYTTAEIDEIWQGSWAGKSSSDGLIARGGYNCRHHFRPYIPDVEGDISNTEPAKPPVPKPKPKPKKLKVTEGLNTSAASKKVIDKTLSVGASDKRYPSIPSGPSAGTSLRFNHKQRKGVTDQEYAAKIEGKVTMPKTADYSMKMLEESITRVNNMADTYNVPKLRAVVAVPKARKRTNASMGDGILSVNHDYLEKNGRRAYLSVDELTDRVALLKEESFIIGDEYVAATTAAARAKASKKLGEARFKLVQAEQDLIESTAFSSRLAPEKWTLGDNPTQQPWSLSSQLPAPKDKFNATITHEFGHQVHQQYGVNGRLAFTAFPARTPPIEKWLKGLSNRKAASEYARSNEHEFFAEAFAAYHNNRKDLVDERLLELFDAFSVKDYDKVNSIIGLKP